MLSKDYLQEKVRRVKKDAESIEYLLTDTEGSLIESGSHLHNNIQEYVDYMEDTLNVMKLSLSRLKRSNDA